MAQHVLELGRTVLRVERHDARAERVKCEEMQEEFGPVAELERDAMTAAIAARAIKSGEGAHMFEAIGVRKSRRIEERLGSVAPRGALEGGEDRFHPRILARVKIGKKYPPLV